MRRERLETRQACGSRARSDTGYAPNTPLGSVADGLTGSGGSKVSRSQMKVFFLSLLPLAAPPSLRTSALEPASAPTRIYPPRQTLAMSSNDSSDISPSDLDQVRSLLSDVRQGAHAVRDAAKGWKDRLESTAELSYPSGISLLSLKNHLLLSYLHHLVALFALKLSSTSLTSTEGTQVVGALVKLRVVLEKVAPLEQKLKYQVEKLVRKADQAADGADEQDVLNGTSFALSRSLGASRRDLTRSRPRAVDPLAFRPNPSNLVLDRTASEDEDDGETGQGEGDRSGVYRPPRLAAMPYVEAPLKGAKNLSLSTPTAS